MYDPTAQPEDLKDKLRRLAGMIPGYQGYMDRDACRDADKALRVRIAARVGDAIAQLRQLNERLSRELKLDQLGEVDRLVNEALGLQSKVEHAEYGFTGLFAQHGSGEKELQAAADPDLGLLEAANRVVDASAEAATCDEADLAAKLGSVRTALGECTNVFRAREYAFEGS